MSVRLHGVRGLLAPCLVSCPALSRLHSRVPSASRLSALRRPRGCGWRSNLYLTSGGPCSRPSGTRQARTKIAQTRNPLSPSKSVDFLNEMHCRLLAPRVWYGHGLTLASTTIDPATLSTISAFDERLPSRQAGLTCKLVATLPQSPRDHGNSTTSRSLW